MASEKEDSGVKSGAKEILSQIFSRIRELSNALSVSDDEPFNNASSTSNIGVINSTVESEVGRVFGRQSSTTSKVDTTILKASLPQQLHLQLFCITVGSTLVIHDLQ